MVVQSERSIGDFSALTFNNNNPSPDKKEKLQRLEELIEPLSSVAC